jgi:hypothetical protein
MSDADVRREFLWARYGKPERADAATALETLGVTDVRPEDVAAFLYRDRESADAYAAANLENQGLTVLGTYEVGSGVIGVLDLRPEIARLEDHLHQTRARDPHDGA